MCLFSVLYLVLESLRSKLFVERCKVSGEILKVVLNLLLLKVINRLTRFGVNSCKFLQFKLLCL